MVISGPSGVGKDTVARSLIERFPDQFYFVVTATTRAPRLGEQEGVDYYFLSHDQFNGMIAHDQFLEYAIVYNDYKGVPKQQIRDALASGRNVIMRVDVQGAAVIRRLIPHAVFVFIGVESEEALVKRLHARRTESDAQLNLRLETARQEMARVGEFDYYLNNYEGEAERAVETLLAIVKAEQCKIGRIPLQF